MNEKELLQLAYLLTKFRASFAWELSQKDRDHISKSTDSALRQVRKVIRNGGSYAHKQFSVMQ